ncbi:MAG: acyltransferase family protein [Burkholderiales bacterium]
METHRFTALDSWRGIAACMVALFHVNAYSHVAELQLVRNAYLFVDFFFVLSGFVIAATYAERLAGGFSLWRFMLLRFGRVYPLHLAVLATFLAYELAAASSRGTLDALLGHLLLVHGLGEADTRLWNVPSWTISTEFFAYLAFALAVTTMRGRIAKPLVAILLLFPLAIYLVKGDMTVTHGYGMIRCLYGFAAGVAAWRLFPRLRDGALGGTLAEVLAIAAVVAFVSAAGSGPWSGPLSIGAPYVFAAVVLVFAARRGAASRVLGWKPFLFLGTVSYSIYMVHYFIAHRVLDAVLLGRSLGLPGVGYLGTDKWAGDLLLLAYLAVVVAVSAATYRLIEAPARERFRRMAHAAHRGLHGERPA